MYFKASDIEKFHKNNKNDKLNVSSQDEREIEAQLQKRLQQDGEGNEEAKKPEEPKFQAFTGKGVSLNDGQPKSAGVDTNSELYKTLAAEYGDDPEMIQGIIMSMQSSEIENLTVPDEPAASEDPANVVNIQLRMPDGSRLTRKFLRSNTLGDIMNFVKKSKPGLTSVKFVTTFPKKVYSDGSITLGDAKFGRQEALNVDAS